MSKPVLPSVPKTIRDRKYRASGICPIRSIVLMLVLGLLIGAVIGAIGHYIGLVIPGLTKMIAKIFAYAGAAGKFVALIIIFAMIGLYPALIGFVIGFITYLLAEKSKCANSRITGIIGFLNASIGYAIFAIISIKTSGMMHTTSLIRETFFKSTPFWWIVLDALIFITTSIFISYTMVEATPFCEDCKQWYKQSFKGNFSINLAEPLIRTLESGFPQKIENITSLSTNELPHLNINMLQCPSCKNSSLNIKIVWGEEEVDKGVKKAKKYAETWLETMVPSELGIHLEREFTKRKDEKKEPIGSKDEAKI